MQSVMWTKPAATPEQIAEAERLEREASGNERSREDSFQRCDTDGFLSQWASGITAQLNREKAKILRDGGMAEFPILVEVATGAVLATKVHTFPDRHAPWKTVRRWCLDDATAERVGRRWIPAVEASVSRVQKQLGLAERKGWLPACAAIAGSGRGLSGCANAYVGVFRVEPVAPVRQREAA